MDERFVLHAMRQLLEFRLVMLERVIEEQRLDGIDTLELAERMVIIFAQLRLVNERLAEMRAMH